EAEVAGEAYRRDRVRKEPVEPVGHRRQQDRVGAAPSLVALQYPIVADVEAAAALVDDQLSKRGDVADRDVEPLAGDRMDDMRGFADEREAPRDIALGLEERQPI